MMTHAANAYARASQATLTPREAEAAVLIKAAGRLQPFCRADVENSSGLQEALVFNQKVWTVFAAAVADPDAPLPKQIRDNVARIALFVFRTSLEAMIAPTARKLDALVSLNHNLAAGLQGSPTPSAA